MDFFPYDHYAVPPYSSALLISCCKEAFCWAVRQTRNALFALPARENSASSKSKAGFVYHSKASLLFAMHAASTVRHMAYGHRSALHLPSHRASSTVRHMAYGGTIAHSFHSDAASSVVKAHFIPPFYIMGYTFGAETPSLIIYCVPHTTTFHNPLHRASPHPTPV